MSIERLRALEQTWRAAGDAETKRADGDGLSDGEQGWHHGRGEQYDNCADELASLIAELGQEVGAVAWMPIDSAPRDGSWIVLVNSNNGKSATAKAAGPEFKTLPEYEWIQWPYINGQPTHWTHCPKETT